jgi:hypothetical protein
VDARERASRAMGSVQAHMPGGWAVNIVRARLALEINEALQEAGVPTPLQNPYRKEILQAFASCMDLLLREGTDLDEDLLKCKQTLLRFFRGVGK